jgi:hypothetical protein
MDLSPYVESLRHELAVAAEAGGDEARALAERLTAPLEAAARLALLEALSAAADEITRELAPGSVEVRLRGRDPDFVVTQSPTGPFAEPAEPASVGDVAGSALPPAPRADDPGDEGTARISLRLPSHLKPRIEAAAGAAGLSVNAWLVRAIAAALEPGGRARSTTGTSPSTDVGRSLKGWVR